MKMPKSGIEPVMSEGIRVRKLSRIGMAGSMARMIRMIHVPTLPKSPSFVYPKEFSRILPISIDFTFLFYRYPAKYR
jgi:hypothetical protein